MNKKTTQYGVEAFFKNKPVGNVWIEDTYHPKNPSYGIAVGTSHTFNWNPWFNLLTDAQRAMEIAQLLFKKHTFKLMKKITNKEILITEVK